MFNANFEERGRGRGLGRGIGRGLLGRGMGRGVGQGTGFGMGRGMGRGIGGRGGPADFNARFHDLVDTGKIPNIVTLVAKHGEIISCDAYGTLDMSKTPPEAVTVDTIFRIASMTKPITSAAMMMLWEEGKWALDDPVSKFIPEFRDLKVRQDDGSLVPQTTAMTMRQLMSHTAGFNARTEYPNMRGGDMQDMIDYLAGQPLAFQPGRGWRYGPSSDIQAYVLEKLTGQRLDEFFAERIFTPLGMVDTGFELPASKLHRLVHLHRRDADGSHTAVDLVGTYYAARPRYLPGGGGFMLSTVTDYWRFSQMMLNGGEFDGRCYLRAATVELMRTNVLEPGVAIKLRQRELAGLGFGLGYAIVLDEAASQSGMPNGCYFWGGIFGTWFWNDPVNDLVVVGFVNLASEGGAAGATLLRHLSARLVYSTLI